MKKLSITLLLLAALVLPVALFLLLSPYFHVNVLVAMAIAVAIGWALNIAWAFATQGAAPVGAEETHGNTLSIATRFGWACPAVLVFLAWLVLRLAA